MSRNKINDLLAQGEYVDWDATPYVACDQPCFALRDPQTMTELRAALEHWQKHEHYAGCSHGR